MPEPEPAAPPRAARDVVQGVEGAARLTAVDALRGLVMVIMALDHVRDFVHAGAMTSSPEDLATTTPALFATRWITHVCAPTFMLLAGVGAYLRLRRDGSTARLSWFLATRGLWLVAVEVTVMRVAMNFSLDAQSPVLLLVLWALGLSMVALAALVHLPFRALATGSLVVIVFHNLLDGIQATQLGMWAGAWQVLHQPGALILGPAVVVIGYPLVPWFAVMAAGFCLGRVFDQVPAVRQRILIRAGAGLVAAFLAVRFANVYGDPVPWSAGTSPVTTLLSFLRATKYPPSLVFVLMTLGPALLGLAWFDRRPRAASHPLVVVGRVPFLFYVAHFFLAHALVVGLAWITYGRAAAAFTFGPLPSMGGNRASFPPGFGYPLWAVYLAWAAVVGLLYPLCRWCAAVKARRRDWWLSYL